MVTDEGYEESTGRRTSATSGREEVESLKEEGEERVLLLYSKGEEGPGAEVEEEVASVFAFFVLEEEEPANLLSLLIFFKAARDIFCV
jgi:hypothetical protein